jgi:tetratricopeptide (TPR) repeat protein
VKFKTTPVLRKALTLAIALALLPRVALADDWTPADTLEVQESDRLFSQSDFVRAEATSRAVLDRHPDSVAALLYHIKDLEALNQTAQALTEARHAIDLSPADSVANEWLGLALVRTGQGEEAATYLQVSLALKPKEESASLWLARAYEQDKQQDEAKKVIDDLLAKENDQQKATTEQRFADTYYQTGDKASALYWWRRSAQLGNPDSAQWLSWAYTNGYGVAMDTGDSAYWSRRTANPDYAWFPRLPFADQIDSWANGWGLVLIAVAAAIILPAFSINLIAFACSGGLTTDPYITGRNAHASAIPSRSSSRVQPSSSRSSISPAPYPSRASCFPFPSLSLSSASSW